MRYGTATSPAFQAAIPDFGEPKPRQTAQGIRLCAGTGCTTRLSKYNKGEFCNACQMKMAKIRVIDAVQEAVTPRSPHDHTSIIVVKDFRREAA
jgi:hypothetical protein